MKVDYICFAILQKVEGSTHIAPNKKCVVYEDVADVSSMIGFPLAHSERDMPGIKPGPLGWHTSTLSTK